MFVRYSFVGDSRQAHLSFSSHADALGALRTMDAILNGKLITDGTRSVPDFAIALKLDHNQIRFAVATGHDEVTSPNPMYFWEGCGGPGKILKIGPNMVRDAITLRMIPGFGMCRLKRLARDSNNLPTNHLY